jgi:hypothetical protein
MGHGAAPLRNRFELLLAFPKAPTTNPPKWEKSNQLADSTCVYMHMEQKGAPNTLEH